MSNFKCEKCGTNIMDSEEGYIRGCCHYPPDKVPPKAFGFIIYYDSNSETSIFRDWYTDKYGTRRFYNDELVDK